MFHEQNTGPSLPWYQKATKIFGSPMIQKATDKKVYLFWIRPTGALLSNQLENWT